MPRGNAELIRGGKDPGKFVDRDLTNVTQTFDKATGGKSDRDLTPGHKIMAGMP